MLSPGIRQEPNLRQHSIQELSAERPHPLSKGWWEELFPERGGTRRLLAICNLWRGEPLDKGRAMGPRSPISFGCICKAHWILWLQCRDACRVPLGMQWNGLAPLQRVSSYGHSSQSLSPLWRTHRCCTTMLWKWQTWEEGNRPVRKRKKAHPPLKIAEVERAGKKPQHAAEVARLPSSRWKESLKNTHKKVSHHLSCHQLHDGQQINLFSP